MMMFEGHPAQTVINANGYILGLGGGLVLAE